jgi:hypothetical protein
MIQITPAVPNLFPLVLKACIAVACRASRNDVFRDLRTIEHLHFRG